MQHRHTTVTGSHQIIGYLSRAVWQPVVNDQDIQTGDLDELANEAREIVAFVVGGNDDQRAQLPTHDRVSALESLGARR